MKQQKIPKQMNMRFLNKYSKFPDNMPKIEQTHNN